MINIGGYQKISLVDYPNHICSTIFTQGCHFRCPFCHNSRLVYNKEQSIDDEAIIEQLLSRKNLVNHICISGGEPLIQEDIIKFIDKLSDNGFSIKLDTNGFEADKLEYIINNCNISYIAMDVKNSMKNYNKAIGRNINISNIDKSIGLIMNSNIDYEFRTTMVLGIHDMNDILDIAEWIKGARRYTLQNYKKPDTYINDYISSYLLSFRKEYIEEVKQMIDDRKLVKECVLNC